jgi:SAM-dependent methyltransferase
VSVFKSINLKMSGAVQWRLPERFRFPLTLLFEKLSLDFASTLEDGAILDVGAGTMTPINHSSGISEEVSIIGMDLLVEALVDNSQLDQGVVADLCNHWPIADASIDLVLSRSVIEHLEYTEIFASECMRVLKPGGHCIHILPGRNAPFSLLNRLLPKRVSRHLLDTIFTHKKELLGFRAYYNDCTFSEIKNLFTATGLTVNRVYCRYYQSTYYGSFFPIYLISVAYDLLVWKFGLKNLSAQLLVVTSADAPDITE